LRDMLVAAQLALAVALAIVGGLVARTASAQMSAPNGFEPSGLLTFTLALESRTPTATRQRLVYELSERLRDRGMTAVGALDTLPAVAIEGSTAIEPPDHTNDSGTPVAWAHKVVVDQDAFDALRIPIVSGRGFTSADIAGDGRVVVVSRETTRRYFDGEDDAVGRALVIHEGSELVTYQIIGVTGDVRNTDPERGMPPRVWVPMTDPTTVTFVARSSGDIAVATAVIRDAVRELAPGIPLESLETYARAISRMQGGDRVAMGMLISFASVAVLFAAIGLYGTVALSANLRRPEFATRYALGAQVGSVASLVFREAFKLLLIGLVPGVALGLLAASGMRKLLFGVTPLDPLNLLTVVALLTVIAVIASLAPAIRTARLDLVKVLRAS
jgi:putative ABC transport system permease protein